MSRSTRFFRTIHRHLRAERRSVVACTTARRPNYASGYVPTNYVCTGCGAKGCKLWRQSNTFARYIRLLCIDCVCKREEHPITEVTPLGRITTLWPERGGGTYPMTTDQAGGCMPAVPCENDLNFWGYTSVPGEGVAWWKRLPLRPGDPENEVCPRCADVGQVLIDHRLATCPKCGGKNREAA